MRREAGGTSQQQGKTRLTPHGPLTTPHSPGPSLNSNTTKHGGVHAKEDEHEDIAPPDILVAAVPQKP